MTWRRIAPWVILVTLLLAIFIDLPRQTLGLTWLPSNVLGRDLKTVYRETVERLRPTYGHWVIFDHCMPFDVTRAYDEATQYPDPRVWTAERDRQMWETLEG
jgi:hypothetical protein